MLFEILINLKIDEYFENLIKFYGYFQSDKSINYMKCFYMDVLIEMKFNTSYKWHAPVS